MEKGGGNAVTTVKGTYQSKTAKYVKHRQGGKAN